MQIIKYNKKINESTYYYRRADSDKTIKLFGEKCYQMVKEKGFKPYITEETRPSGTTYYIVVVDENAKGNIGDQLRSAGFECYPIF